MKKLNRKGFTLIELLAVIVILAIVLVVTIPSVIGAMNDARTGELQNSTNTVQKWFTDEYALYVMGNDLGTGTADEAFKTFWGNSDDKYNTEQPLTKGVLIAAGVAKPDDNLMLATNGETNYGGVSTVKLINGKVCVKLVAQQGGSFYNTTGNGNTQYSSNCELGSSNSGTTGE